MFTMRGLVATCMKWIFNQPLVVSNLKFAGRTGHRKVTMAPCPQRTLSYRVRLTEQIKTE